MAFTVLTIADTVSGNLYDHFDADEWRAVDLVLSAGDLPPEYLDFLCTALNVPVVYVRGNHDGAYESSRYDGCINAHGTIVEINGLRIAGFEGSRRYNNGPYQYSEGQMRRLVRRTRIRAKFTGGPHIVLSHAPPCGCHDAEDQCHQGFECFRTAIEAWQPELFVHGHVHSYNGGPAESMLGSTMVVNAYRYRLLQVSVPSEKPSKWRRTLSHHRFPVSDNVSDKERPAGCVPAGRGLPIR